VSCVVGVLGRGGEEMSLGGCCGVLLGRERLLRWFGMFFVALGG